jgi:hypothetical protein
MSDSIELDNLLEKFKRRDIKMGYRFGILDILDLIDSYKRPLNNQYFYYRISIEDLIKEIEKLEY